MCSSFPTNWRLLCMLLFVFAANFWSPIWSFVPTRSRNARADTPVLFIHTFRPCLHVQHTCRARSHTQYACTDRGCTIAKRIDCSLCLHASAEAAKRFVHTECPAWVKGGAEAWGSLDCRSIPTNEPLESCLICGN